MAQLIEALPYSDQVSFPSLVVKTSALMERRLQELAKRRRQKPAEQQEEELAGWRQQELARR